MKTCKVKQAFRDNATHYSGHLGDNWHEILWLKMVESRYTREYYAVVIDLHKLEELNIIEFSFKLFCHKLPYGFKRLTS